MRVVKEGESCFDNRSQAPLDVVFWFFDTAPTFRWAHDLRQQKLYILLSTSFPLQIQPTPPPLFPFSITTYIMTTPANESRSRTLVLCFDGTGDRFDDSPTNVVRLFSLLDKSNPDKQLVYYQPGIGTFHRSISVHLNNPD